MSEDRVIEDIEESNQKSIAMIMRELMELGITEEEEIEEYYWCVETENEAYSRDVFWVATNQRVLSFYVSHETAGFETLFYYNQNVFVQRNYSRTGDILQDKYPIEVKSNEKSVKFKPSEAGGGEEEFIEFMKSILNHLVNDS